jgi:hypothetical protein
LLLDTVLSKEKIDPKKIRGYEHEEFTHTAIATSILAKKADVGMGVKNIAIENGLDFIQLKDELFNCPPVLVMTARKEDAWLATWSRAEANVLHPIDPFTLAHTVADLLRASLSRVKA